MVEVDGGDLVLQVAVAVGATDECGDGAVETFTCRVGNAVLDEGKDVVQPRAESSCQVLKRFQTATLRPSIPFVPDLHCRRAVGTSPQGAEEFLERPGPPSHKLVRFELRELLSPMLWQIFVAVAP